MKPAGPPAKAKDGESDAHDEWKTARETIGTYDDRIHDIRKYGISFITALLTAQSLLTASTTIFEDNVKIGILLVTLVLLVTLRQMERVYQLRQKAVALRAVILERALNIELTETITERSKSFHMTWRISLIYISFAVADFVLGLAVMKSLAYKVALGDLTVLASSVIGLVGLEEIDLTWGDRGEEGDWTMDRLLCNDGRPLKITLTNMSPKKPIEFNAGDIAYVVRLAVSEHGNMPTPRFDAIMANEGITVKPGGDYTWYWPTEGKTLGIYQVFPTVNKGNFPKKEEKAKDFRKLTTSLDLPACPASKDRLLRWVFPKALSREVIVAAPRPAS